MTDTNETRGDRVKDPLHGTPIEAIELPDDIVGIGASELAYLLSRHDSAASRTSGEFLLSDPRIAQEGALIGGASSLVSRGWLTLDENGDRQTRSYAALIEYVTGKAYRWSRIGFVGADGDDVEYVALLESDTVTALMQPRQLASWFVRLGEPDVDRTALVTGMMKERFAADPAAAVILQVRTADGDRTLAVRPRGEGYEALRDVSGPGTGTGGTVDEAGLTAEVARLYGEGVAA
ncbi:hypothetical protein GCM10009868_19300 [Terrabacter aerolatus]|uniref:Uncharacterized protein n=1 Tax=Terrabacter aerolatus TaxID=422442 RepID=A0A512D015_9MICO|nr:hypothetical protein [Terrabacter aerolatus]GEO29801.1 hypothetical protein TAE01_16110 [Terrabacter aerolatus]